ncbi:hypothetical protein CSA17_05525 [bacterium DOLJORAL78_65_58]|nr:MAG: hypothetical protein CSA17_05525 [bacterium DOLJORAL78_65_58]
MLATSSPLVLRPDGEDKGDGQEPGRTVFHLPIGRGLGRALLSVVFRTASRAHHFHTLSAEVIYLVNRHMATYLDRLASDDQVNRLTILAGTLTELSAVEPGDSQKLDHRICAAACQLTGARQACILRHEHHQEDAPAGPLTPALRQEAVRLLRETGNRGWSSTILGTGLPDDAGQSLLVVPLRPDQPFPGLVLINKKRLHPLDGASFTEFDALFARRILPVFHAQSTRPVPATLQEEPMRDDPMREEAAPTAVASQPETRPEAEPDSQPESRPQPFLPVPDIRNALAVEMDRCRRYHNMVGVVGICFSPRLGPVPDGEHLETELARKLRSSDQVGRLEDGTLLVVVPEDIQSLKNLKERVIHLLREISGQEDLIVRAAHRVFPGTGNNADDLIDAVLGDLR